VAGEAHFEEYGRERFSLACRVLPSRICFFAFLDFAHLKYGIACPDDGGRSLGNLQCLLRGSLGAPTKINV
jgi:hypothetical protein